MHRNSRKPIIIASLGFKRRGEGKSLRDLCKYLQYRDGSVRRDVFLETGSYPPGVSDSIPPGKRQTKWVDRGMGDGYREIVNRAHEWQGRRTLARTWVISPDPELMRHVPEGKRLEMVARITEKTVERWYSDNGWGTPEYSYVVHDKHRVKDGEQMGHAHIITPGTVPLDEAGELGRIDHIVKRPHIRDLHQAAAESFREELGRVLGRERAQEIIAERDKRIERERDPGREGRKTMRQLKAVGDVLELLDAEKAAREARKQGRKRKRHHRQRMTELRMYARYLEEGRRERRESDRRRMALARREEHESELHLERERQAARLEKGRTRYERIVASFEEDMQKLEALRAYFDRLTFEPPEREQGQELELED